MAAHAEPPAPPEPTSAVDAVAAVLRREILDGRRPAGARLVEADLRAQHGAARHTIRAALRALAAEGLVRVEPNRGASVARLEPDDVRWLYELRAALELEAARLALERHDGVLPAAVHDALAALERATAVPEVAWSEVTEAHNALHGAIVVAAASPRIAAAHAALSSELRLFLVALEPLWTPERMRADHVALVGALESGRLEALREHLREASEAVAAARP
jgi:DNA-binding GntR family transcriptional regulator